MLLGTICAPARKRITPLAPAMAQKKLLAIIGR